MEYCDRGGGGLEDYKGIDVYVPFYISKRYHSLVLRLVPLCYRRMWHFHSGRVRCVFRSLPVGVVHAWVGQIVLNCNVFKTEFVRPTETRVEGDTQARGGHGRP